MKIEITNKEVVKRPMQFGEWAKAILTDLNSQVPVLVFRASNEHVFFKVDPVNTRSSMPNIQYSTDEDFVKKYLNILEIFETGTNISITL